MEVYQYFATSEESALRIQAVDDWSIQWMLYMSKRTNWNGYNMIQEALSKSTPNELVVGLVPRAMEVAKDRIGQRDNDGCNTHYHEDSVELFIWALGLICQEWILENLRLKSLDGHCWTHKQQSGSPCAQGSTFHKELYESCKKSFEEVLRSSTSPWFVRYEQSSKTPSMTQYSDFYEHATERTSPQTSTSQQRNQRIAVVVVVGLIILVIIWYE